MLESLKIGVSACLCGERVLPNARHRLDPYINNHVARYVELVPLCPEMGCGMGVPREPVCLRESPEGLRLTGEISYKDWTDAMVAWTEKILPDLVGEPLCGFILSSDSPTCSLDRVRVFTEDGKKPGRGQNGIFADLLQKFCPTLPVEDSLKLGTPMVRDNFIKRVFVRKRWLELMAEPLSKKALLDFHTRHKLLLRSQDLRTYRELGKLLGESDPFTVEEIHGAYEALLFQGMALNATPGKNTDALMHALGYFKDQLSAKEKELTLESINDYKAGRTPLLEPMTLLRHYARRFDMDYLKEQHFLNPEVLEMKLRFHG